MLTMLAVNELRSGYIMRKSLQHMLYRVCRSRSTNYFPLLPKVASFLSCQIELE